MKVLVTHVTVSEVNKVKKSVGLLLAGLLLTLAFSFFTSPASASDSWSISYDSPQGDIYSLAVYGDKLYAATGPNGIIYTYDGSTWSISYDSPQSDIYSLAVYGDKLYAGTGPNGIIYTYDGSTWSISYDSPEIDIYSLAVYGDKLYAATSPRGVIYTFDGATWSTSYDSTETNIYSLVVYGGNLYAGTDPNGIIYTYDGSTWSVSYDSPDEAILSHSVYGDKLYTGTSPRGVIYTFDGATWSVNYDSTDEDILSFAVYGGNLYAGTNPKGLVLTYDGATWSISYDSLEDYIYSLAVYGGKLYASTGPNGLVYVYTPISFDFSISASPDNVSLARSDSTTSAIMVSLVSGTAQTVSLSGSWVGTAPTGVSASLIPLSGTPGFSSTLTITTTSAATAGTSTYRVTGTGGGLTRTEEITVTVLAPPGVPSLLSPGNGTAIDTITPTFDWSDVAGATEYTVEVATDNLFANKVFTKSAAVSSVVSPTDLSYGTIYYWRVKGTGTGGSGDWSSTWSFTAKLAAPKVMSFVIEAGAAYTNDNTVQLTIAAQNAVEMSLSSDGIVWGDWETYQTSKSYALPPGDGSKSIYIRVRDNVGDISQISVDSIALDQTSPSTTYSLSGDLGSEGYKGSVVVTLTSTDATSGISSTKYRIDGDEWKTGNTFVVSEDGRHTIEYYSTDAAGNSETAKTLEVTVYTPTAVPPFLSQYWWATLSIIVVGGVVSTFIIRRVRLAGRLKRITREKAELLKLRREAETKYFRDGSISRDTFDTLIEDYERRKAELEKEERVLQAKVKHKKLRAGD